MRNTVKKSLCFAKTCSKCFRTLSLFLIISVVCISFIACGEDSSKSQGKSSSSNSPSSTESDDGDLSIKINTVEDLLKMVDDVNKKGAKHIRLMLILI